MRVFLILVIASAAALWWGGQHLYLGLRDREPVEITCADYLKQHPESHWLKLTKCDADLDNIAYEDDSHGGANKVYVPLRPLGEEHGKTHIVVQRDDQDIRDVVALGNAAGPKNPAVQRVAASFDQPIEGIVQSGIDLSDSDREKLAQLGLGLADDFVIVERGTGPKLALGALVFALGLLGPGFIVFRLIRRRRA